MIGDWQRRESHAQAAVERELQRGLREDSFCLTCQARTERVDVTRDPIADAVRVVSRCHGRVETLVLDGFGLEIELSGQAGAAAALGKFYSRACRVFPRAFAQHGRLGQPGRLLRAARPVPRRLEVRA